MACWRGREWRRWREGGVGVKGRGEEGVDAGGGGAAEDDGVWVGLMLCVNGGCGEKLI